MEVKKNINIVFPVSMRETVSNPYAVGDLCENASCVVVVSATANGPEKLALKGYLETDLFVATRDNPIDQSAGVDLGGVIFTPGEVDQLKDELVLRLHKVNEGSAEWEWTSGLAEHINRILQLEFEKTVRHC